MVESKKQNSFGVIAGAFFIISFLFEIIANFSAIFESRLFVIGFLFSYPVIAVGLFLNNKKVIIAGLSLMAFSIIWWIIFSMRISAAGFEVLNRILLLVPAVLLLFVCFKKEPDPVILGIIAALILIVAYFLRQALLVKFLNDGNNYYKFSHFFSFKAFINRIIFAAAFLFSAISMSPKANTGKSPSATSNELVPAKSDKLERLSKLKSLLDSGIITQEEFEAKKKDLLS